MLFLSYYVWKGLLKACLTLHMQISMKHHMVRETRSRLQTLTEMYSEEIHVMPSTSTAEPRCTFCVHTHALQKVQGIIQRGIDLSTFALIDFLSLKGRDVVLCPH